MDGKTPYSREQLEAMKQEAERFMATLADRQARDAAAAAAALAQRQAYTLLVRNYTNIREALQYVRREEGDADVLALSLFLCRGRRCGKSAASRTRSKERPDSSTPGWTDEESKH